MRQARRIGRLGILAAGVGIGAAVAATAGVASADLSTDPFSWIGGLDLGDLSVPAQAATLDMQISIDGMDLFPTAGNTATATSGVGDIAIAIGNGADAIAVDGTGDFALADGTDAGVEAAGGDFDSAIDIGNNTSDTDITWAGAGDYNSAIMIGSNTGDVDGSDAGIGNHDTAIQIGSNTGDDNSVSAWEGNYDTTIQIGNLTGNGQGSAASFGNDNLAYSVGNQSVANADGGNDNIAYVLDPTGTYGSYADAAGGGYDLAAVLGVDHYGDFVIGAPDLYDIVTPLGNESGTAASTSGGFLADLLSLF